MRISDWSSDVCSSDLAAERGAEDALRQAEARHAQTGEALASAREARAGAVARAENQEQRRVEMGRISGERFECPALLLPERLGFDSRSEEHTSELQSLMRNSYAVFCLKKKNNTTN